MALFRIFIPVSFLAMVFLYIFTLFVPKNTPAINWSSSATTSQVVVYEFTMVSAIEENVWYSMNHKGATTGSAAVLAMALSLLSNNPDQLQLWAGVDENTMNGTLAGTFVTSDGHVAYVAWKTPVKYLNDTFGKTGFSGYRQLGKSKFSFNPKDLIPSCAWIMTEKIGHEERTDFLSVGAGMERWHQIQIQYKLNIFVGALPVLAFKK